MLGLLKTIVKAMSTDALICYLRLGALGEGFACKVRVKFYE